MKRNRKINIQIIRAYTVPPLRFDLLSDMMLFLRENVQNLILPNADFSKVTSEILEINITPTQEISSCQKISKNDKGKYLTFHFWISFPKVVRRLTPKILIDIGLSAFVSEFKICLSDALLPYGVHVSVFEETKKAMLDMFHADLPKYTFMLSEKDSEMRLAMKEILEGKIMKRGENFLFFNFLGIKILPFRLQKKPTFSG